MHWQQIEDFKREPAEDTGLRKGYAAEVKADDTRRELTFKISTAAIDRVGDTVAVDGWDLTQYLKNPVVLWAHDGSMLPIGKATKVWADNGALHATAEFTPPGMVRFNDVVFDLYKGGFLNAVSVGFRPTKWAFSEDKDRKYGIDFMSQELLEFSAVPVPANPEALIEARSAGQDVSEVRDWAITTLKTLGRPETIREFEELLRALGYSRRESERICAKGFHPQGEPAAVAAPKANSEAAVQSAVSVLKTFSADWFADIASEASKCRNKISPMNSSRL